MRYFFLVFILFFSGAGGAAEKQKSCQQLTAEQGLAGGAANEFYGKCAQQAKISCEEAYKRAVGIQKMRGISACIKARTGG